MVSWRKIRDIVCINKWCERFCKEYDAKFLVYTEGDVIPTNVKLVFDETQAIFSNLIEFEDMWYPQFAPIHEEALTAIDRRTTDIDIKRANETKDYRELIHLYQYVVEHDAWKYLDSTFITIPCRKKKDNTYDISVERIANLFHLKGRKQTIELLYRIEVDRILFG